MNISDNLRNPEVPVAEGEEEETWSHWEDPDEIATSTPAAAAGNDEGQQVRLIDALPPQLHPAVHRVSSCYLSIGDSSCNQHLHSPKKPLPLAACENNESVLDLLSLSLWEDAVQDVSTAAKDSAETAFSEIIFHDILMNVFTFLDCKDIGEYSRDLITHLASDFYILILTPKT